MNPGVKISLKKGSGAGFNRTPVKSLIMWRDWWSYMHVASQSGEGLKGPNLGNVHKHVPRAEHTNIHTD